jgi:small subunit ribosomal protein S20
MPQIKSRKKDLRKAEARHDRNLVKKRTAKMALRAAREGGSPEAPEVAAAYKALDKAAKAGVLHQRTAARRKSRLMAKLNAAK